MKIKFKLSVIMIIIMSIVLTGIVVLLLRQSSDITMSLSIKSTSNFANFKTEYWQRETDTYLQTLRTLAAVMGDYEDIPAEIRRDRFDDMMYSTVNADPNLLLVYTTWKPNAVDNMDSYYIGRPGSTATGQYAATFTREGGEITLRANSDIPAFTAYINGPNAKRDRAEHPIPRTIDGRDTYVVRMMVPIINFQTNEAVGGVGMLIDIAPIQTAVLEIIKNNDEVAALTVFSGNGFIMAHMAPQRIGSILIDVETIFGDYIQEANRAVHEGREYHCRTFSPLLNSFVHVMLVPIEIGNSGVYWSVMLVTSESYILAEIKKLGTFAALLAIVSILLTAGIVFIIISFVTKPVVLVTDTLRDISEGEGDLTHTIDIHSKDETGALAHYFNLTIEKIKKMVINIGSEANALSRIGVDLAHDMTETAASMNEITANIQSIRQRMLNQSASVTETNATMEQITVSINKLNGYVEKQSSSVARSSSAIEQMLANVNSVTQTH